MAQFDLRFQVPSALTAESAESTFYWPTAGPGTFNTSLGPRLGELGPVRRENIELFRLAAIVYAADRSVPRRAGRANWTQRDICLSVPVQDPAPWNAITKQLQELLDFLSGDRWTLAFRKARIPREGIAPNRFPDVQRVVLMSGGAGAVNTTPTDILSSLAIERLDPIMMSTSCGRRAEPDMIANAICFLADDHAAVNINGVVLPVDAAWSVM